VNSACSRVATPGNNLSFTFVDFNKPGALEGAIKPNTKAGPRSETRPGQAHPRR
jgi:hypothetical protein